MNINALVKLFYLALVISTLIVVALAVIGRRRVSARKEANRLLVIGPIAGVVVAVGFFVLVGAIGFYSPPNSCVSCHEMTPEYNTWRRSLHSRVTCLACHLRADGAVGYIIEDAGALREVWLHITGGYPKIINRDSRVAEEMSSSVCERCHKETKLGTIRFGNRVKISHQPHIRLGINCTHCHNRITHDGARGFNYLNGLRMMDGCMRCHLPGRRMRIKGKQAPTDCSTCHPKNFAVRVFGKSKPTKADFDECRNCHRLRNPRAVADFSRSKMSEAVDCPDCHKNHFDNLIVQPDPVRCEVCHKGMAKRVAQRKHGRKAKGDKLKSVPTDPAEVRCTLCHPSHRFGR